MNTQITCQIIELGKEIKFCSGEIEQHNKLRIKYLGAGDTEGAERHYSQMCLWDWRRINYTAERNRLGLEKLEN